MIGGIVYPILVIYGKNEECPRAAKSGKGVRTICLEARPSSGYSRRMPRPLRPIDARLVYHVVNRGNNRAAVFLDDDDYAGFLKNLGELEERWPFLLYGY